MSEKIALNGMLAGLYERLPILRCSLSLTGYSGCSKVTIIKIELLEEKKWEWYW